MSQIYTRTGDSGQTMLSNGKKTSKSHIQVECYGTIDEVNSWIGFVIAQLDNSQLNEHLTWLQHRLSHCACLLSYYPDKPESNITISKQDIAQLETWIDDYDSQTGELKEFILPGGSSAASSLHIARTVIRRAERHCITLAEIQPIDATLMSFINRCSDYLFSAARKANHDSNIADIYWSHDG